MGFTNRTRNALLAALFGKSTGAAFGALASRPTIHLGLSSTYPTVSGTNVTEPSTGSYARVETAPADWNDPSAGVITNANLLSFPKATAAQGKVGWLLAMDAATSGNLLAFGPLADLDLADYQGEVASQVAMLALDAAQGDWCVRTDLGFAYELTGTDPSVLGDWTEVSKTIDANDQLELEAGAASILLA